MTKRPLFVVGTSALAAAAAAVFSGAENALYLSISALWLGLLVFLLGGRDGRRAKGAAGAVPLCLVSCAVATAWVWQFQMLVLQPLGQLEGETVSLTGLVEQVDVMDYGSRYRVRASLAGQGPGLPRTVKLTLYTYQEPEAEMGESIAFTARLAPTQHLTERSQGYFLRAFGEGEVRRLEDSRTPRAVLLRLRQQLWEHSQSLYSPTARGMVQAMTLGLRSQLDPELQQPIQLSGAAHILAISGLHLSIVFQGLLGLSGRLGLPRRLGCLAVLPVLLAFLVLAGLTPSVLRAGIMSGVYCLSVLTGRQYDGLSALGLSSLLLLGGNPYLACHVGFVLSYLSVLGILVFAQPFTSLLLRWAGCCRLLPTGRPWFRRMAGGLAVSLAAYVFIGPVLVAVFGNLPLLSPLTTLLILWAVPVVVLPGMVTLLLAFVPLLAPVNTLLVWVVEFGCRYLLLVTRLVSGIPHSVLYTREVWAVALLVLLAALLVGMKARRGKTWPLRPTAALVLSWTTGLCLAATLAQLGRADTVELTGVGEALVLTKNGSAVVVGCVADRYQAGEIQSLLRERGVTTLQCYLSDHRELGDCHGLPELLAAYPPQSCILPREGTVLPFVQAALPGMEPLPQGEEGFGCQVLGEVVLTAQPWEDGYAVLLRLGQGLLLKNPGGEWGDLTRLRGIYDGEGWRFPEQTTLSRRWDAAGNLILSWKEAGDVHDF